MSDVGDDFRALREYRKVKKEVNYDSNITLLNRLNISFTQYGYYHLGIKTDKGVISFYPSTGLWFYTNNPKKQWRGIKTLLRELGYALEYVMRLKQVKTMETYNYEI